MDGLPIWNLARVYPSPDCAAIKKDYRAFNVNLARFTELAGHAPHDRRQAASWIKNCIGHYNTCSDLLAQLYAYAYMRYSVNTADYGAINLMNELDRAKIPLISSLVAFRNILAAIKPAAETSGSGTAASAGKKTAWREIYRHEPELEQYEFFLNEQLSQQKHQMSREQEELAADLSRAGADLWSRLQEAVSSQTAVTWDEKSGEKKTLTELRALAHNPDRTVRRKAFTLELSTWESVRVPLAYALNGVKGFSVSLNSRRNYADTLECSLSQARINRRVLDSLIGVMETSLPEFRRYLKLKAKLLGVERPAFFDLFAPLAGAGRTWSFKRAGAFIIDCFSGFSPELGEFARRALAENWVDARPRAGKVGGAYCISLPLSKESRVLSNFDGSFSAVTTLAHELGHAYHHHLLREDTAIHRDYPMTLAETASIFSENIIINNAMKTLPPEEKIHLLEQFLADSTQVIVDILSRYYFESELLRLRETKELSAEELNGLMLDAQRKTYGSGLDPKLLHPYMWAVKGHYYRAELAFYNYPYAFGLLFGLGLHALYAEQGGDFPAVYASLLKNTGKMNCMELTGLVGFDIESPAFWEKGIRVIKERIDELEKLARGPRS
jgi:oligoendopeptidase F